jgi:mannose-1-phosphate guanylyltransferase/phosphomannomutase
MNAMILAAGLGTRLGDMGRDIPKVLIDIGGRPLLERHLEYLERLGIRRVVINLYHLAGQVEAFVRSYAGQLEVVCVREDRLLGTAGGVRNAVQLLEPGPFVVLYGDVLVLEPLGSMLVFHRTNGGCATLAVHRADSAAGKGIVEVQQTGRVTGFAEKERRAAGPVLINSGIYVLESDLLARVSPGVFSDFGADVFPTALASGLPIYAYELSAPVIDIGTHDGLSLARSGVGGGSSVRGGSTPGHEL